MLFFGIIQKKKKQKLHFKCRFSRQATTATDRYSPDVSLMGPGYHRKMPILSAHSWHFDVYSSIAAPLLPQSNSKKLYVPAFLKTWLTKHSMMTLCAPLNTRKSKLDAKKTKPVQQLTLMKSCPTLQYRQ